MRTMVDRAHIIDLYSWLPRCRRWGDARRGPGRTQDDRRREQLVREAQGRTVQPVIPAKKLAARPSTTAGARQEHSSTAEDDRLDMGDLGGNTPEKGAQKRRRVELMHTEATVTDRTRMPEPVAGSATRGKRKRTTHRTASDAKRRREAAAAGFDGTDTDEDGPAPAGPARFSAPEVEEPDNPMDVG